jgi:hypothetical protein
MVSLAPLEGFRRSDFHALADWGNAASHAGIAVDLDDAVETGPHAAEDTPGAAFRCMPEDAATRREERPRNGFPFERLNGFPVDVDFNRTAPSEERAYALWLVFHWVNPSLWMNALPL